MQHIQPAQQADAGEQVRDGIVATQAWHKRREARQGMRSGQVSVHD